MTTYRDKMLAAGAMKGAAVAPCPRCGASEANVVPLASPPSHRLVRCACGVFAWDAEAGAEVRRGFAPRVEELPPRA